MDPARIEMRRILCPVDFSEFSSRAMERAVALGNWFDARVEVLHVVPFITPAGPGLPYFPAPVGSMALLEQSRRELGRFVEPFLDEGVPIETRVVEGNPWRVIRDEALALPADLLVMGTHGRSGFEHLLLGSVTEKVLRCAPCPVLTLGAVPAPPRRGPLFRRILCAADLTPGSEHTLAMGLSLAEENASRITLLHAVEYPSGEYGAHLYLAVPEIGPLRRDRVEQGREALLRAVPDEARDFCDVTERVETGTAWRKILQVAEEMDADLIVMGAHTQGALGRALFGSTATHVVRQAPCPVLVVRETEARQAESESVHAVAAASVSLGF